MSCFNFEYMLVGQFLLDEACYSSPSYPLHPQRRPTISPTSSSVLSSNSKLLSNNVSFHSGARIAAAAPFSRTMERTLYPILEADEEGKDYDQDNEDDDDDDYSGAFDAPFLRLFKSCLVQFVYMMPVDKALKSPPTSPRKR